jgi:hypothetical protein
MSARKPRADSVLKNLEPQQQEELMALLRTPRMTYKKALPIVEKEFSVKTSEPALSAFYSWFPLSRQLEKAASLADQIKQQALANPALAKDAEALSQYAQISFEVLAAQKQNVKEFVSLRKLRLKETDQATAKTNTELRVKQYEQKIEAARASLEKAKSKGGVSRETMQIIEQQLAIL